MADNLERIRQYGEKGKEKKIIPYLTSRKTEERAAAARALGGIKTDVSFNKLIIMLEDPDLDVRKSTVEALGQLGDKKAQEFLRHAMKNEEDPEFQELARKAMASLKDR